MIWNFIRVEGMEGMQWSRSKGIKVAGSNWGGDEIGAGESSEDVSETKSITSWVAISFSWWTEFTSVCKGISDLGVERVGVKGLVERIVVFWGLVWVDDDVGVVICIIRGYGYGWFLRDVKCYARLRQICLLRYLNLS